jgi:hypothetical protein
MAILIAGDILYDFPSASLTIYNWGTSDLAQNWLVIFVEYAIWFGLIALILFVYTAICVTFDRHFTTCVANVYSESMTKCRITKYRI